MSKFKDTLELLKSWLVIDENQIKNTNSIYTVENNVIYNSNNGQVIVITPNKDIFSGLISTDDVVKLKTASIPEIIDLLKVNNKEVEQIEYRENQKLVSNFLDVFENSKDFEIINNNVYLKGFKSINIDPYIVARFIELIKNNKVKSKEYNTLLLFTAKLLANPNEYSREDAMKFIVNNDIKLDSNGNLILYRNIVKLNSGNKDFVEFISTQYFIIKGRKKSPKNYIVGYNETKNEYKLFLINNVDSTYENKGNLNDLYNELPTLKENKYTSWHSKGRYTIKIGSLYKMDESIEKLETGRFMCCGGNLHAANVNYDYSGFGDTKVVVLVNPTHIITVPSNDSGKISVSQMWIACYNPNPIGTHFDEKGLEGISNDYDNYTLTELNEILRTQNIDLLNKNDVKSNLTLQDVLTLKSIIENKVVKI